MISNLCFSQAQAFRRCDLRKGVRMVEPMVSATFAGRPTNADVSAVINRARNDAMRFAYSGGQIVNPYLHADNESFALYGFVARQTIEEDKSPYEKR